MASERYCKEIEDLRDYFAVRLPSCGPIVLTSDERKAGVDSLRGMAKALVNSACTEWILTRNYELSYNQVCCAFFAALESPPPQSVPVPTDAARVAVDEIWNLDLPRSGKDAIAAIISKHFGEAMRQKK